MSQLAGGELLIERKGSVLWIIFNRPESRNALTWAMYEGLADQCRALEHDPSIRAVVISGAGHAFASGTDIAQFRDFRTLQDAVDYEARSSQVMDALEAVPVPVIAAIAGSCTGGGAGLASCCDLRIASRSIKFGIPIARTLGNCLSHHSYARLVALLGLARAKDMLMTGRLMGSEELLASGFVCEAVDTDEALPPRAQELAEQLAANAPLTLAASKRALLRVRNRLFPVEEDRDIIAMCYLSEDFREGVEAFLAKRKPVWRGR